MIGVRLPERMIKKIGKVAEALSSSDAVRWLLEQGLDFWRCNRAPADQPREGDY